MESAQKDIIDGHHKTINYARSNQAEFSKDQTQDVADAIQQEYGGGARQAYEEASRGSPRARAMHMKLNAGKFEALSKQINQQAHKIDASNNVEDFAAKNQVDNTIGGKRDEFAKANNIRTDGVQVEKEIGNKGEEIKAKHQEKHSDNADEYQKTEKSHMSKQTERKEQIDQYEKDRIGNGKISTLKNRTEGLGRLSDKSSEQNVKNLNLETKELEPLPRGSQTESKLKYLKNSADAKHFNKKGIQNNTEPLIPETTQTNRGSETKGKADGQYVDPKIKK